jgi:PST family polysaccharide transporter
MQNNSKNAFKGIIYIFSANSFYNVVALITNFILARILVPEDFSAIALIMSFVALIDVIAQMGVSVAFIQKPEPSKEFIDTTFFLTLILFFIASILLFFVSKPISIFYNNKVLKNLLKIASAITLLNGISSFYNSLMLKKLRFNIVAISNIVSSTVFFIISIFLAKRGYKAYSLVIGNLVKNLVMLLILIISSKYVPKSFISSNYVKEIISFGFWVSISRILNQASGQFDRLFIGKFIDDKILGGYYLASKIVFTIPSLIAGSIDQVLLPIYSKENNNSDYIEKNYWSALKYSSLLVMPISTFIFCCSKLIIIVFLGEKWLFISPILQIISIAGIINSLGSGIFSSAVYSSGIPKLNSIFSVFRIIVLPLSILIGVSWGLVIYHFAGRLFNQWLLKKFLNYDFKNFFKNIFKPIIINIFIVLVFYIMMYQIEKYNFSINNVLFLLLLAFVFCTIYLLFCIILMKKETIYLINNFLILKRRKSK